VSDHNRDHLKKAGLKVTLPRMHILNILESAEGKHHSAEEIYKRLLEQGFDIGLATVYRVLTQFEESGFIIRHRFEDHSVFELNSGEHHDHIVCLRCNRVEEFIDATIEAQQKKIARRLGYEMVDHTLYLQGICASCQVKI
jgi:Fur family transcriptional regulator, ferric uptake regulator